MAKPSGTGQEKRGKAERTREAVLLFAASYLTVAMVAVGSFLALI